MIRSRAARVSLLYVLFGALWILLSDQLIAWVATPFPAAVLTQLQTVKGWFFVATTGLLLYLILKREIGQLEASKQSLEESNQRLISIRKRLEAFQ
ncbi:MAG: hypothetical protein KFF50_16870, partial [Desulfatitalea sp.]|nr:hypothetical protein [Desulfatitalea sp.]